MTGPAAVPAEVLVQRIQEITARVDWSKIASSMKPLAKAAPRQCSECPWRADATGFSPDGWHVEADGPPSGHAYSVHWLGMVESADTVTCHLGDPGYKASEAAVACGYRRTPPPAHVPKRECTGALKLMLREVRLLEHFGGRLRHLLRVPRQVRPFAADLRQPGRPAARRAAAAARRTSGGGGRPGHPVLAALAGRRQRGRRPVVSDLGELGRRVSRLDPALLAAAVVALTPAVHEYRTLRDPFTDVEVGIDVPLVGLVRRLWAAGIPTSACCQDFAASVGVYRPGWLAAARRHPAFAARLAYVELPGPPPALAGAWRAAGGLADGGGVTVTKLYFALEEIPALLSLL